MFLNCLLLMALVSFQALAVDVSVYRGVNASPNGNASLAPGQFVFNNDLSTFDTTNSAPVAKPCLYRFTVTGVPHNPPQVYDTGTITGLVGYVATFDDNPNHHWSISKPNGVTNDEAKQEVSQFAKDNRVGNVVNGTQNNCY